MFKFITDEPNQTENRTYLLNFANAKMIVG